MSGSPSQKPVGAGRAPSVSERTFVRRVVLSALVGGGLIIIALLVWQLLDVLVLLFGAIVVAVLLHAIADPIARRTPLSRGAGLAVAGLSVLAVLAGTAWVFSAQVSGAITDAYTAAKAALPRVGERLGVPKLPEHVSQAAEHALSGGALVGRVTTVGFTLLGVVADLVLIVFGGVYLAVDPTVYRRGLLLMFPPGARPRISDTLDLSGSALKHWLLGQLVSMVATGALVWLALWLIGVPSAAGLALIAGVLEFVPLLGPFAGAVPAILVAASQDLTTAAWTALAFVVIQQVESNILQPFVLRQAVSIPPAVLLFSVVAFGALFGLLGALLAAPLTVVSFVAIRTLYVRAALEDTGSESGT